MSWARQKRERRESAKWQRRRLGAGFLPGRPLRFECLEVRRLLSLAPIISEVEASNKSGILDVLGHTADWLELYNPDPTAAADLSGWTLSYQKTGSHGHQTYAIPSGVILGPGEFRVVFCDSAATPSTDPMGELDTGYNLSKDGATVQLLNTSGGTGPSRRSPIPTLGSDTSYGPLETVNETDLVAAGATASYYCPTNNALGTTWTQPSFNASCGRRVPRAWGSPTASTASPARFTMQTLPTRWAAWRTPRR